MYEIIFILNNKSKVTIWRNSLEETVRDALEYAEKYSLDVRYTFLEGKEIVLHKGAFYTEDDEPLCTNEAWHAVFASPSQRITPFNAEAYNV